MAIFASVVPSSTKKMVKKGQKMVKNHFSPHPHKYLPKMEKNIEKVARVVGINLTNSALVLMGHI